MKTMLRPSGEQYFLKDAIRDLIIVIVGILAALFLESWWQDRQDRAEEALLLVGLRSEFVANQAQLTQKMSVWSFAIDSVDQAVAYMVDVDETPDAAEIAQAFKYSLYMQFFDPRTGQLTSLISSGKLGLIENADLRAKIADWPGLVEDLNVEREIAMISLTSGYRSRLNRYISPGENPPFENRIDELLADREIYSEVSFIRSNLRRMLEEGEIILQAADEIIAMIDNELKAD
jgi:hypothetical protein